MADQTHNDGTLSTAMSQDGNSALPNDAKKDRPGKERAPNLPNEGGEDEGSSSQGGSDDHLKEDQKPTQQ